LNWTDFVDSVTSFMPPQTTGSRGVMFSSHPSEYLSVIRPVSVCCLFINSLTLVSLDAIIQLPN